MEIITTKILHLLLMMIIIIIIIIIIEIFTLLLNKKINKKNPAPSKRRLKDDFLLSYSCSQETSVMIIGNTA